MLMVAIVNDISISDITINDSSNISDVGVI